MGRLDDAISDIAYILDALMALRDIIVSGYCNSCKKKMECKYCPKPGELARYNCPFYEQEEGESDETHERRKGKTV